MKNNFTIILTVMLAAVLLFPGCGGENKFSMKNIIKAAVQVIKKKGFTELSAESINEQIEKMYSEPEDVLQRSQTIRDQGADKSLNYKMIFEDTIDNEKYQESRKKSDPFKK